MKSLEILLATYNGERFIEEQIRSLMNQTYRNWTLLVHDDGSSDRTLEIVRQMAEEDSRIRILDDGVRLGSAPDNFIHLLRHSTAERIMFCDQDDVWFPEKVELMMKEGERLNDNLPGVIYSRANFWNPENGIMGETWRKFPRTLPQLLGQKAAVQGAAALINGELRKEMLAYSGPMVMHDHLLALIAYSFGEVRFMNDILMNYRQHDSNVTGNSDETKKGLQWVITKLTNFRPVMNRKTLDSVEGFYKSFESQIPECNRAIFNAFFKLEKQNRLLRIASVRRNGFGRDGSVRKLIIKMALCPYL